MTHKRLLVLALTAALVFAAAPVAAQEDGPDNAAAQDDAPADKTFSSVPELLDYIETTSDFAGQFQPYIVPAAAFAADGGDPDSMFFFFSGGRIQGNSAAYGCVQAPVQLPDGATIVNLFIYAVDNDATNNMSVNLWRKANGATSTSEVLATATTSGSSTSVQIPGDISVASDVVNNRSYSYFLTTCLPSSSLQLHGAWIFTEPGSDIFNVAGSAGATQVLVQEFNTPSAKRQLMRLENEGPASFAFEDKALGATWEFAGTTGGNFQINALGSPARFVFQPNGGLIIRNADGDQIFKLTSNGELTLGGGLTGAGLTSELLRRVSELESRLAELEGGS